MISPARQSISSSRSLATSPDRDVPAAAPRGLVARGEKASNLFGSQPLRQPDQSPACNRWHGGEQGPLNDAVEMQEPEKGSKGRDRQFRRPSTLSRTTGHHEGDDVGCGQAFEIQRAKVSREPSLNERAHHVEVGARRDHRQSALDGQVTPESIEHYVYWTQGCVESLSRDDLNPLKIIKDGAYCPDRDISVVASGSTMSQETINIASSQIRRDHAVAQKPIAQIGQYLHLQTDGSRRISQLRQLRPIAFRRGTAPSCTPPTRSSG
jgi:hypothetical protein